MAPVPLLKGCSISSASRNLIYTTKVTISRVKISVMVLLCTLSHIITSSKINSITSMYHNLNINEGWLHYDL